MSAPVKVAHVNIYDNLFVLSYIIYINHVKNLYFQGKNVLE